MIFANLLAASNKLINSLVPCKGGPKEHKLHCYKPSFKKEDKGKVNSSKKFANRLTPQQTCQSFCLFLWRQFGGQSQPAGFAKLQTFRQTWLVAGASGG